MPVKTVEPLIESLTNEKDNFDVADQKFADANKGFSKTSKIPQPEPEYLENPKDPTDEDWDKAIYGWMNAIDPDLFKEGKGTILDAIVYDIENNGGVGTFFDDNYPKGIPYNKVSDERKRYAQNKIDELANSKFKYLLPFVK